MAENSSAKLNDVVQPLLTDLYQITMAYAYWKSKKNSDHAVFDLFFRKNPFDGEFTIFAGLEDCLKFLEKFHYSESDIDYLKRALPPDVEESFFEELAQISLKDVKVYAIREGTVVFPRIPLIRVEGPVHVVQLLETTLLTLVNYASLVTTNAARFRLAAGSDVLLTEYGLRRAQGPDGGLSASRYTYMGGFDGTSNVLAGKMFDIPVKGTQSHAFIMSYSSLEDCRLRKLVNQKDKSEVDFMDHCIQRRKELSELLHILEEGAIDSELAAFIAYAIAFPNAFLALIDTYSVEKSGLLNFCAVALALNDLGYKALGVRLDSGDLAYLSRMTYDTYNLISDKYNLPWFKDMLIVASNEINEETIYSLKEQAHKINCFGVGTHLVTCQKQPALGCVFKLAEINSKPCIKISANAEKVTIPGSKTAYRLYGKDGYALVDLMQKTVEPPPKIGERILVRHPFEVSKRAYINPVCVENLHELCFSDGKICVDLPPLSALKERVTTSLASLRSDIKRYLNPTPYKMSLSNELYDFMHSLWLEKSPIGLLD